jgi:hypothetical protein
LSGSGSCDLVPGSGPRDLVPGSGASDLVPAASGSCDVVPGSGSGYHVPDFLVETTRQDMGYQKRKFTAALNCSESGAHVLSGFPAVV